MAEKIWQDRQNAEEYVQRYEQFLDRHKNLNVVFIELGIGYNTPVIIKYPFWQMTDKWQHAHYICLNYGQAYAPDEIKDKSVCVNMDIDTEQLQVF